MTYHDGLPPMKSKDPLIKWSFQITWQIEHLLSSPIQCLLTLNMVGWWLIARDSTFKNTWPFNYMNNVRVRGNIYISPFALLMVTKLRTMLTSRSSFSTQMLKLLLTSCLFFPFLSFSLVFLYGLTKVFIYYFFLWKVDVSNNGFINIIFHVFWGHVFHTEISSSGRFK